jgi:acylphosphatase
MAYFLLKNLKNNSVFIHYNGSYHSDNFEGIYWYLKKEKPQLNVKTISIVEQQNVKKFAKENKNLADFIIVVDKFMTKTY